jgi:CRISPR-associated endonuclease Csn1
MDLDWTCPFTGRTYMAHNLSELEREHIIPYTDRPTNALDAQVLTFPWVNKLKAKRTALQFIMEIQGDDRFQTPQNYKKWVDALKVARRETYPDDYRRQSARKRWLLVEEYKVGEHGFTQGALTQTSHLNRLAHRQLERQFVDARTGEPTAKVHAIPGQITAEARKAWNLLGTLVPACPECAGKQKTEIREITHLHHALDAATLALVHHYLPGRLPGQPENQKGLLWQALLRRRKTLEEIELLTRTGVIKKTTRTDREGTVHADALLVDLPTALKHQLAERLKERRVVQHVPADQSGALLELNPWRVSRIDGDPSDPMATVHLQQRTSTVENGKRLVRIKKTTEKAGKLIGLRPGKLHRNKSVLVIAENYGIALEPFPSIVPFHQVSKRLSMLRRSNHGQTPRILRNGMLLRIREDDGRFRLWRIFSAKAPAYLDLADPDAVKMQSRGERYWRQVSVVSLLKSKSLEIVQCSLTGVDPEVLTDSNAS